LPVAQAGPPCLDMTATRETAGADDWAQVVGCRPPSPMAGACVAERGREHAVDINVGSPPNLLSLNAKLRTMADPSDDMWMPEAAALALCGMKRPTWTGWSEQGIVARPSDGAYGLPDVIRVALLSALRKVLAVDDMAAAWRGMASGGIADQVTKLATTVQEDDRLDLVIEPESGRVLLATDDQALAQAVRHPTAPRAVIVISPAAELHRVVAGFANRALSTDRPTARRRGRPKGTTRSADNQAG
jgi:hypothetical protein